MKKTILALISLLLFSNVACTPTYKVRNSVVQLSNPTKGYCSGIQFSAPSGSQYILTAGHCRVLEENGSILVAAEGKPAIPRRIVNESPTTDLLLLEGIPGLKGVKLASETYFGETFRSFQHGAHYQTYKAEGEFIDLKRISVMDHPLAATDTEESCTSRGPKYSVQDIPFFIFTIKACVLTFDAYVTSVQPIVPGSSGGGVVNNMGDLVGIVSAGDTDFSFFVTLEDILKFTQPY